jgi:predicted nucleic acid-binding protein
VKVLPYTTGLAAVAGPVFCDTSFLLDAFTRHLQLTAQGATLTSPVQKRLEQAYDFLKRAQAEKTRLATSLLVLEELYHKLLFKFVLSAVAAAGHKGWKDFRAKDETEFLAKLNEGRRLVMECETLLLENMVDQLTHGRQPGGSSNRTVLERNIAAAARLLLDKYAVDTMDGFHYAAMLRFGIEFAASSDRDWKQFPSGTLVCFVP